MNCEPGNVALIIKGRPDNIGRIVFVASHYGEVDYTWMGYGVLPCWNVETLGNDLDTDSGPSNRGFIPDLALRVVPGISNKKALRMRKAKARADFCAALSDLAQILRSNSGVEKSSEDCQVPTESLGESGGASNVIPVEALFLPQSDLFLPGVLMNEQYMLVEWDADKALADPEWTLCELEAGIRLESKGYIAERPGYYRLPQFKGKYWITTERGPSTVTTRDIALAMRRRDLQRVSYGPYNTEEDADYRVDVLWESPCSD
jgi:hypothetical protein